MAEDAGTPAYEFLSDEWLDAVRTLRDEYVAEGATAPVEMKVNLIVTEVPFSDDPLETHLDTSGGGLIIERGHLEGPDLKVTVDWVTAKALLVEGRPQAAMSAFMEGKVRVEGDVAKLMAFQTAGAMSQATEAAERIRSITA